ncbi:SDR family NAD(P)-dependent oxidoreductase [Pedobacter sp. AW31-3R]|uniref:SDR family NAD(P)-dependent oxidoreductase n=1 Tax=Pedobacter sp. AW31-3R TaxID=3445781 RepID=UPI003FA0F55C
MEKKKYDGLEIAIIGISGQFPGSKNHIAYWDNLVAGKDLIKTFSEAELLERGHTTEELNNEAYVRAEGIVADKDCFDHGFFNYTPEEARLMDPQLRLFHENCWKALEDAGYAAATEEKKIGLFAGASSNNNWKIHAYSQSGKTTVDPFYLNLISSPNSVSSLVSYKLNLRGPAVFVDTACSTSLSAIHLACRSLLTRESELALAGGVSLNTKRKKGYLYKEGSVTSKDGRSYTFDARANGTSLGEGLGVVVLKRLSEAIKDGDHIYAIIKSTAMNNDGNGKVGFTAPSVSGQAACIRSAMKLGGVDPKSISYVEAHGTATPLGDPIEIRALNEAFGVGSAEKYCRIGSVKTNIGHLDTAAGVAGLIKTALSLKYKKLPASIHYQTPNPFIDLDQGPFFVNTDLTEWLPSGNFPLRAGVSSFGIGGTNAHVILEEAPALPAPGPEKPFNLLVLSARSSAALKSHMADLKAFLLSTPEINAEDMAYSYIVGRKQFNYRKSLAYSSAADILEELNSDEVLSKVGTKKKQVVFLFPGQGTQYRMMGKELYDHVPFFKEQMDQGFLLFEKLRGQSCRHVLFEEEGQDDLIHATQFTQPLIFILQHALAQLLMAYGVTPTQMIGHSLGEYTAACLSGIFSFEDCLSLIVKRSELMSSMPSGSMLSAGISRKEATAYLTGNVSLAAVNAPGQVVFSGATDAIEALKIQLTAAGISCALLHTSHAFHSAMQEPILEEFSKHLGKIKFGKLNIPFISNLTGEEINAAEAGSIAYWGRHLRETVNFSEGVQQLLNDEENVFLEVGTGQTLSALLKQHATSGIKFTTLNTLSPAKRKCHDLKSFNGLLGKLWELGVPVTLEKLHQDEKRQRIPLPVYSFEQPKFLAEVEAIGNLNGTYAQESKTDTRNWIYYPAWKQTGAFANAKKEQQRRHILLFSGGDAFAASLKAQLDQAGHRVTAVIAGNAYLENNVDEITIDPAIPEHYVRLCDSMASNTVFTDVIYTWGLDVKQEQVLDREQSNGLNLVYFGLVRLLNAFPVGMFKNTVMTIVSNALYKITGNEKLNHVQSLTLGLVNTIQQEYGIFCRNIDINLAEAPVETVTAGLVDEFLKGNVENRTVGLRYGQQWLRDFQRNEQPLDEGLNIIRHHGVYLITGGLGNVGFILAKYLLTHYDVKLVLIGRTELSASVTVGTANSVDKPERLSYLQRLSPNVAYHAVDISNENEFLKLIDHIESTTGSINGVLHTAGELENKYFQFIENIQTGSTMEIFAAKVRGMENLYQAFKDRALDFAWITSSIATVLGGLGYSAYASANLYMEHFLASKQVQLANWKILSLSALAFSEQDIKKEGEGMRTALKPEELIQLFQWILTQEGQPVIFQSVRNLNAQVRKVYLEKRTAGSAEQNQPLKGERPELSTQMIIADTNTEKKLLLIFETLFAYEHLGIEDDFFELGGDSLKAMSLLKRLKQEFDVELSMKDVFAMKTIKNIAELIDQMTIPVEKPKNVIII